MKSAVILAAGSGKKIWPYNKIRSKTMISVSNSPIISYNVSLLIENGFDEIFIMAKDFSSEIKSYFKDIKQVKVINIKNTSGSADTLLQCEELIKEDYFLTLYGDSILPFDFFEKFTFDKTPLAFVSPLRENSSNVIGCNIDDKNNICDILAHPREGISYIFAAFLFNKDIFKFLKYNSGRFTDTQVGMMSPIESYLEMSVSDYIKESDLKAVNIGDNFFDIDKPWHILIANEKINKIKCQKLTENVIGENSEIDKEANITGFIKLGKNSKIGKGVVIKGNVIVGDNTVIESGAILNGNNVIGDNCYIGNYPFISENSTVGNNCVINHCAELDGIIFNRVYLYHYMEIYGIIGENTDIGAATVCGALRFDDGECTHITNTRKETPCDYSSATFIGDYCRTGVNVILAPGKKIGPYSIIGAGTILNQDVKDNSLVYPKQELITKEWGPDKYGW